MSFLHNSTADLVKGSVFVALLVALLLLEARWPRRHVTWDLARRLRNLALIAVSTLLLRLMVPAGAAAIAASHSWGVMNKLAWPDSIKFILSLVVLDAAIYWQHRAFHAVPILWRAHRVHHSDLNFDVSLGVRFHPFEILPSFVFKLAIVLAVGVPAAAVVAYESLLLGFSLWSHANLAVPERLDRWLRWGFITPDWHRVHHSVHADEGNSNFGNILSVWDRMFGSAREVPRDGHADMKLGLPTLRSGQDQRLQQLLLQPFQPVHEWVAERREERPDA